MKHLSIIYLIAAASILVFTGCGNHEAQERVELPSVSVSLASVEIRSAADETTASGSIFSGREAMISSRIMGQLVRKLVKPGDTVKKNEKLLTLDDRTVQGQISQAHGALSQAKAAFALAETNIQRFRELHKREAASQLELDMAEMQFEQARGAVEQATGAVQAASSMLDDAIIRAPFSGTILDVMVKEGDMVVPGYPILRLADRSKLELVVSVKESDLSLVKEALSVTCDFPSADLIGIPCTIAEIVSAADPMTHTFTVKLRVKEDSRLLSGMYGTATFYGTRDRGHRIFIPKSALVERGQLSMVFTVEDGTAAMKMVRKGEEIDGVVEILSGLSGGEEVVDSNAALLSHGLRVEVGP